MDRRIVYPGALPQDTDILQPQRNALMAMGQLVEAILGSGTWTHGLACIPGTGLNVVVQPGQIYTSGALDANAFGSLVADAHTTMRQAALRDAVTFGVPAPLTVGQSINYLIQIRHLEVDTDSLVLPYYNSANPAVPLSGPANSGDAQNTTRSTVCDIQILAGVAAATGSQATPAVGAGYIGWAVVTVNYGDTTISGGQIVAHGSAPLNIAKALLAQIKSVDGSGSGLDADTLQGHPPSYFARGFRGALVYGNNATNAPNVLSFPSEAYDTDGIHDPGAPTRLTVPAGASKVKVKAYVQFDYTVTLFNVQEFTITRNGASGLPGSCLWRVESSQQELNHSAATLETPVLFVTPGTYFEIDLGSGIAGTQCWFAMEIIE